jgi:hypothetical protein
MEQKASYRLDKSSPQPYCYPVALQQSRVPLQADDQN